MEVFMKNYFGKKTILSTTGALLLLCACISCGELTDGKFIDAIRGLSQPGGIVFYDKGSYSDGWRYLAAAPVETEFTAQWGAYDGEYVTGTSSAVGSGKRNTEIIVAYLQSIGETGTAAQLCDSLVIDGYDDWFLPSSGELELIYTNLYKKGIGEFVDNYNYNSRHNPYNYWSSGDYDSSISITFNFLEGTYRHYYRDEELAVRAVRAF
jgi:hypothetical protein